jgi:hypothetical protein
VAPPGNQAANRENKRQPIVSEETGLLDSKALVSAVETNGEICWVQQRDDRPRLVKKENTETYGAGALLLAGSEMVKLHSAESIRRSNKTTMPFPGFYFQRVGSKMEFGISAMEISNAMGVSS